MRITPRTVVSGRVVLEVPSLATAINVSVIGREREEEVHLSSEEVADLEAGIAEADRGEMIPGDEFFAHLRRFE